MTAEVIPPDGGCRAIIVVIASFLCNGLIFGFINTYSVLHTGILKIFMDEGVENASVKASLIGSLTMGTTFFLSMLSGIICDRIGIRLTTFIGGFIACSNVIAASFFTDRAYLLMFTYGFMFGVGASLTYVPSLSIVGHYYKRYIGIANGIVTVGSSVFSVVMPYFLGFLVDNYGLNHCLRVMGILLACLMLCSLAFKPLYQSPTMEKSVNSSKTEFVSTNFFNQNIWKSRKYNIWVVAVPIALCGYLVPYVHMGGFIKEKFPEENAKLPISCIALTSGIGRIIFGFMSDLRCIDSIMLQQISFLAIGIISIIVPLTTSYFMLVFLNLILGLFDGCFVSVIGPIAVKFCGPEGAGQAIGFVLGFSSLPLIIGPPIAASLHGLLDSYTVPFIVAGIPPILGALLMTLIHFVKSNGSSLESERLKSNKLAECISLTDV